MDSNIITAGCIPAPGASLLIGVPAACFIGRRRR